MASPRAVFGLLPALALAASLPVAAADLSDMSLEDLMQVSVVGASKYEQKQSAVAAAVSVITRQQIKSFGWRTLDEALASLPGIYTTYDRQYAYIGTRGFSVLGDFNTRILLTIDGNRVNDAVYDQAYIGRDFPLDLNLIERIEFIPGPGGAVYGQNALFGVINVVTRSGESLHGAEFSAEYQLPQQTASARASWGAKLADGTQLLFSVSGMHSTGVDRFFTYGASGVSGVAVGMDGERDTRFLASATHGAWSAEFVQGDRRKDDPTGIYRSDPLVPGTYQRDNMSLAQLQYHEALADGTLNVTGRVYLGRERYDAPETFSGALALSTAASDWRGVELRAVSTRWSSHTLLLGAEYQDNQRQDQAFVYVDPAPGLVSTVVPVAGWRAGVYLQDEWKLSARLNATLGLREDRNDSTGNALSPRAALIWQAASATTLKALYGRAHRTPNAFEFDYTDGVSQINNPALRPETIDTLELVADQRIGADLAVRASLFKWTMKDLVTLGTDPVGGLPQYRNGAPVTAQGAELSADRTWEAGARLRSSLTYEHAYFEGGGRLKNSPALLGKLNYSTPLPATGLRLGYELQYSSSRQSLAGATLGGYTLSNLMITADHWVPGLEVSLGLYNLLDKHYAQPGARNNWQDWLAQDGASARLKLSYAF